MAYDQTLPPGTVLNGVYLVERVLGWGGFANTYVALDQTLGRQVAIKEYFPSEFVVRQNQLDVGLRAESFRKDFEWALDRFVNEAITVRKFNRSPNIVRVFRTFDANNTAYIALEYIDGPDFEVYLSDYTDLIEQAELDQFCRAMLDALELVHSEGILHRDVKPRNIIRRTADKNPVLIDFGAAKYAVGSVTRTTHAIVSQGYSPQEAYSATSRLQGPWTDIYGLAATLYRAIDGKQPMASADRVLHDTLTPSRELRGAREAYRPTFLDAIDWGLSLRPGDRPKSIAEWRPHLLGETDSVPLKRTGAGIAPTPQPAVWKPFADAQDLPPGARSPELDGASLPNPAASEPAAVVSAPAAALPQAPPQPSTTSAARPFPVALLAGGLVLVGGGMGLATWQVSRTSAPGSAPQTTERSATASPSIAIPAPAIPDLAQKSDSEAARQRQAALDRQRDIARQAEQDRQRQAEADRQRQAEAERQRQAEADRQRQAEAERQRQAEADRQRQAEADRQRQAEADRQRQAELERQRQAELERQRQAELERQRQAELERQRQAELERQRQAEIERQRIAAADAARRAAEAEAERVAAENLRRERAAAEDAENRRVASLITRPQQPETNFSAPNPSAAPSGSEQSRPAIPSAEPLAIAPAPRTLVQPPRWTRLGNANRQTQITAADLSQDGQVLLAGGLDGTVRLWRTLEGTEIAQRNTHARQRVVAVAAGPQGSNRVASASVDGAVVIWDTAANRVFNAARAAQANRRVLSLSFDPTTDSFQGMVLSRQAAGGFQAAIESWSMDGVAGPGVTVDVGAGFVTSAAFARASGVAVAAIARESQHLVGVIDRGSGRIATPLTVPGWVRTLAFSSDGALLAAGGQFDRIMVWDMRQTPPRLRAELQLQSVLQSNMAVTALAFGQDNRAIALGSENGAVVVLDVASGRAVGDAVTGEPSSWLAVLPVQNRHVIAFPGTDGATQLRNDPF